MDAADADADADFCATLCLNADRNKDFSEPLPFFANDSNYKTAASMTEPRKKTLKRMEMERN